MKLVSFTINSRTVQKIQHGGGRRYRKFPSKFWDLKVWHSVLFYSKLVPVHVYWYCLCYIKIWFYCTIPYWEYLEKNSVPLLKSYERFTAGSPRWRRCWWRHLPMSDDIFSSRGKNRSTLAQVMACCLMAPSHYLNQCWLTISKVLWHSSEGNYHEIWRYQSVKQDWTFHFKNRIQISQGPMS